MDELMVKVENVTKEYRLGAIGGTTLREELQRARARRKHEEDPTLKIGEKRGNSNEHFMALNGVSFEVKRGEAVGIIGHNGAGKSTLLKLITRITAPTSGKIYLNGRIASMLEVGTGFHPELTGRENVYLNGAILGMTKKEIDAKMDDIIEFSEVRQFIDTPVKRYSSGMYVKLAFSVAAHLDSEIMIMDEVLAVGDVAFQNKCIQKMKEVADSGRTVLYVSHNMATIRKLCNRCIVLERGQLIYDGDVESAIAYYTKIKSIFGKKIDLKTTERPCASTQNARMKLVEFTDRDLPVYTMGEKMCFRLQWTSKKVFERMIMRIGVVTSDREPIGISFSNTFRGDIGENSTMFELDISHILPGKYFMELIMNEISTDGKMVKHDVINSNVISFEVLMSKEKPVYYLRNSSWGKIEFNSNAFEEI